jgi:hypothetical protein
MIEGINASLVSTQASRVAAEAVTTAKSYAANPDKIQQAPIAKPYISPFVKVDANAEIRAVLQLRDSNSGEVIRQFPTDRQLQAFARSQEILNAQSAPSAQRAAQVSAEAAATRAAVAEAAVQNAENNAPTQVEVEAPAPQQVQSSPAPEANVSQAQQSGQTPQTPVSDFSSVSQTV